MTPVALRQVLEAERARVRSLADALHDQVRVVLGAGGSVDDPAVKRLLRITSEVTGASTALSRAIGELELLERADARQH